MKRTFAASTLALLLALPAVPAMAQFGPGISTDAMGRMDSPEQKASAAYSRGLKAKRKAEEAKEPAEKLKLYTKAKEELSKAAAYVPNYDAYLALGQVYLAMGQRESAISACQHAQNLKPSDEAAKGCLEEAAKKPEVKQGEATAAAMTSDNGGR